MTTLAVPDMQAPGASLTDSVYQQLLRDRIVFLGSEVTDDVANRIIAQLLLLAADDPDKDITFYINSPGGSVTAGMAIYDTMQLVKPDVSTWGLGFVASMGQFLLSSGTPGKRYLLPNTRIVMHQPSAGIGGAATDIAIQAESVRKDETPHRGNHRPPNRPERRTDHHRRRPGPLVRRRRSTRLRLRRPHRRG